MFSTIPMILVNRNRGAIRISGFSVHGFRNESGAFDTHAFDAYLLAGSLAVFRLDSGLCPRPGFASSLRNGEAGNA